jgi:hypothetical protein
VRPVYRQKGIQSVDFTLQAVKELVIDCCWLRVRLSVHTMDETTLKQTREKIDAKGEFSHPVLAFSDLFYPAPWLDKSPPQAPTPSEIPGERK